MANEDFIKQRGATSDFKDDRGGATLYPHPIVGIVKNNIDPLRSGKIQVQLNRLQGPDSNNPDNWTTVSYLSPFFGNTPNTGSPDAHGTYVGNRNSYGFWATPPDLDSEVICIFINGDPLMGYYIGGIPQPSLTHMVPAVGASSNVIPNAGEAESYGGAVRLPVSEYNDANKKQSNSPTPADEPRPIHSYQAAILNKQGLLRDPDRGAISSSSVRESPSRVFGMSTPGRPIYSGGYDDETISEAIDSTASDSVFKVIGRTGGHSIVMDDGDAQGRDQLTRLRTSSGHMIMMNDYAQTLFIIHANGQSYIEMGKEGTIDMYSTNSVNIRTQGDLNLHADKNININAAKDLNIAAKNIKVESTETTSMLTGTLFKHQTKGDHTVKVAGKVGISGAGEASLASGGQTFINGSKVNLNTGTASLSPADVPPIPVIAHTDTLADAAKGYIPAPGILKSITSRAPAHAPWANANQGVDVKVNPSADAKLPAAPSKGVSEVNSAASTAPMTQTSPAVASTVANAKAASPTLDKATSGTLVSQMAVNAATGPAANAVQATAGVVDVNGAKVASVGAMAMNPTQMCAAGTLKPGADIAINKAIQAGAPLEKAFAPTFFTGKDGIKTLTAFTGSTPAQTNAATSLLAQGEAALKKTGLITGKESPTQTGGLILSAATAGVKATVDFAKNAMSSAMNLADAAGSKIKGFANSLMSPSSAVSSGNFASGLADKAMSSLSGAGSSLLNSAKGAVAGVFGGIADSYKALKAGIPQSLLPSKQESTEVAKKNTEGLTSGLPSMSELGDKLKSAFGSATDSLGKALSANSSSLNKIASAATGGLTDKLGGVAGITSTVKGLVAKVTAPSTAGTPNIPGLPAGAASISNVVNASAPSSSSIPGLSSVTGALSGIASSVSKGISGIGTSIAGLKDKLLNSGGLDGLASKDLLASAKSKLDGALSSMGLGGPGDEKAPTVADATFSAAAIEERSAALLGDVRIPKIPFGASKVPPVS
jgi:hypothetical protein